MSQLTQLSDAPSFDFKEYRGLEDKVLNLRIKAVKQNLGDRLVILGHHYQQDGVIAHADLRGDSLQLSQLAGERDCDAIVFCGVHFMAETADIVSNTPAKVESRDGRHGLTTQTYLKRFSDLDESKNN